MKPSRRRREPSSAGSEVRGVGGMRGLGGPVSRPAAVRSDAGGSGGVVEGPRGGVVVGARAEGGVGRLDVRPGGVGRCGKGGGVVREVID